MILIVILLLPLLNQSVCSFKNINDENNIRFVSIVQYKGYTLEQPTKYVLEGKSKMYCFYRCIKLPGCCGLTTQTIENHKHFLCLLYMSTSLGNTEQRKVEMKTSTVYMFLNECTEKKKKICHGNSYCVPNYSNNTSSCICRFGYGGNDCKKKWFKPKPGEVLETISLKGLAWKISFNITIISFKIPNETVSNIINFSSSNRERDLFNITLNNQRPNLKVMSHGSGEINIPIAINRKLYIEIVQQQRSQEDWSLRVRVNGVVYERNVVPKQYCDVVVFASKRDEGKVSADVIVENWSFENLPYSLVLNTRKVVQEIQLLPLSWKIKFNLEFINTSTSSNRSKIIFTITKPMKKFPRIRMSLNHEGLIILTHSITKNESKTISCHVKPGNMTIEVTQANIESSGKWMLSMLVDNEVQVTARGPSFGQIKQGQVSIHQPRYINNVFIHLSDQGPTTYLNNLVVRDFSFKDLEQGYRLRENILLHNLPSLSSKWHLSFSLKLLDTILETDSNVLQIRFNENEILEINIKRNSSFLYFQLYDSHEKNLTALLGMYIPLMVRTDFTVKRYPNDAMLVTKGNGKEFKNVYNRKPRVYQDVEVYACAVNRQPAKALLKNYKLEEY